MKRKIFIIFLIILGIAIFIFGGFWIVQAFRVNRITNQADSKWEEINNIENEMTETKDDIEKNFDEITSNCFKDGKITPEALKELEPNIFHEIEKKNNNIINNCEVIVSDLDSILETISQREKLIIPDWYKEYLSMNREFINLRKEYYNLRKEIYLIYSPTYSNFNFVSGIQLFLNDLKNIIEKSDTWPEANEAEYLRDSIESLYENMQKKNQNYNYFDIIPYHLDLNIFEKKLNTMYEKIDQKDKQGFIQAWDDVDKNMIDLWDNNFSILNIKTIIINNNNIPEMKKIWENSVKKYNEANNFYNNGGEKFWGKITVFIEKNILSKIF